MTNPYLLVLTACELVRKESAKWLAFHQGPLPEYDLHKHRSAFVAEDYGVLEGVQELGMLSVCLK